MTRLQNKHNIAPPLKVFCPDCSSIPKVFFNDPWPWIHKLALYVDLLERSLCIFQISNLKLPQELIDGEDGKLAFSICCGFESASLPSSESTCQVPVVENRNNHPPTKISLYFGSSTSWICGAASCIFVISGWIHEPSDAWFCGECFYFVDEPC